MSTELTTPIKIEIPGIGTIESADLYLKSEADKVIAELKKERDWLAKDRAQAYDDLEKRAQLNIKQEESNRHQKYKRSLDKAEWCGICAQFEHYKVIRFDNPFYLKRAKWLEKWRERWLNIAEQFKEAK